jgi:hypothetical protein
VQIKESNVPFQNSVGQWISAVLAEPPTRTDRTVILCHGFLSNKNSKTNQRLTELLLPTGISTFRFDWFGQGESEGNFKDATVSACCDDLKRAIRVARSHQYTKIGIIGSSYGGFIAILVASHDPDLLALGLKCPVPDFPEMLQVQFGPIAMDRWRQRGEIPNITGGTQPISLDYAFHEDCLKYDAYSAATSIKASTLIVHGDQDEIVPFHQIRQLERSLSGNPHLQILPGANHHFARPEDFRKMTTMLADWMRSHLSLT